MELKVQRAPAVEQSLLGELSIDGTWFAHTLENATKAIPAGRYPVTLTYSPEAREGPLWSPDPDDELPLVNNVKGRSGIRLHAANTWSELEGCIAVGQTRSWNWLGQSRAALTALLPRIAAAVAAKEPIWLDILDPPAPGAGTVTV